VLLAGVAVAAGADLRRDVRGGAAPGRAAAARARRAPAAGGGRGGPRRGLGGSSPRRRGRRVAAPYPDRGPCTASTSSKARSCWHFPAPQVAGATSDAAPADLEAEALRSGLALAHMRAAEAEAEAEGAHRRGRAGRLRAAVLSTLIRPRLCHRTLRPVHLAHPSPPSQTPTRRRSCRPTLRRPRWRWTAARCGSSTWVAVF
jgi:hypothetical protein